MRPIVLAMTAALASAASAAHADSTGEYSLTVYSSAQPGQIDTRQLANYGNNLPGYALVRDQRVMRLDAGRSTLRFSDVAARMDPTTVAFESLTDPAGTRVIEQNYQYDLVSGQKLLERFLGETVTVEQTRGTDLDLIVGKLLSAQNGLTLQLQDGSLRTLTSWSGLRFPSLPGGLITKPTLVWDVDAKRAGDHKVRVAYQSSGMTWWADYNATLDERDSCKLDLTAWVTLVNQSGGSFPNAQLKLVAGEVNRAPTPQPVGMMMAKRGMVAEAPMDDGFTESGLFEYHLYTLGRRTDVPDNATKQLELFPAVGSIPCQKELLFTAAPGNRVYWQTPNMDQGYAATQEGTTGAYLLFKNRKEAGLGIPLPAGRVRVNQAAQDGSLEFIGEDLIQHTPRNEELRIKLGNAFDIAGERKQTDFKISTSEKWIEESFEINVRNRKQERATVRVREYLYRWSQWSLLRHSHTPEKRDAQTVDFVLDLPADGESTVKYTVRYSW
ncbi:MAG: DUF4139 domain-containing protein [Xanthomonadales bacterium]|nr:DUF4139 domain-containing protein [Xanthomonadales bacterium]